MERRPTGGEGPRALFKNAFSRAISIVLSGILVFATLSFIAPANVAAAAESTVPPMVDNPANAVTAAPLPTAQINGIAWDQVIVGNTVYVGGEFTSARPAGAALGTNESPRQNLMSYNLTTGVMTSWAPNVNGRIRVITASPDGSRLYIGGAFTTVNGQPRNRVAAFNTSDGSLVANWAPVVGADVFGIAVGSSAVYLGGWFSSINGVARTRLGAVSVSSGALTAWAPTADFTVQSLGLTQAEDRVIVSGGFSAINGVAAPSFTSLDAVTGEVYPFAVNQVINNSAINADSGQGAGVTSIKVVGNSVFATGWSYYRGNFEGMVKVDAYTGQIQNLMECRGDTYDAVPFKGLIYTVSHHHRCDGIGGFPQATPWTFQHSDAVTEQVTGQVQLNFPGQPAGSYVNWFPTWRPAPAGTGSNAQQAGWSTEASGDYLAIGGEFLMINGIAQQGLVRFGTHAVAGASTSTPAAPAAEMVPTLRNISETSTRLSVKSQWDRDNMTLTTNIFRLDVSTTVPIHSFTGESTFWNRPVLSWVDTGLTTGQTYTYRVQFVDADGNKRTSAEVSIVAGTNVPPSSDYSNQVFADGALNYWRLDDAVGATTAVDWSSGNDLVVSAGVTMGQQGAVIGSADTAASFSGASGVSAGATSPIPGPNTFSQELWFSTTTTAGGKLLGFGSSASGDSGSYDRHVYMGSDGRLTFGVYPGGVRTVSTAKAYNDGAWHHVVTSLSAAGMVLWVDGIKAGEDTSVTSGQDYTGYWRVGGDNLGGWPSTGSSNYFNGTIDDVAIYPTVLTREQVRGHFTKSGRTLDIPTPPSDAYGTEVVVDDPTLFWRLNETGGATTARDANGNLQDGTYYNDPQQGQPSDVVAGDTAVGFDGTNDLVSTNASFTNPTVFSLEAWFNTTTTSGGKIIGFGRAASGNSSSYDRHVYMSPDGRLNFGAYNGSLNIATSPASYNDGAWHQAVATMGPGGMALYVDGVLVATNPNTVPENYTGYWRVGGDNTWSGNPYFNGRIDEVSVYSKVLGADRVFAHYRASGVWQNHPPTVSIGGTCTNGACSLVADATDPDGSVASLAWDLGDGATSTETSVVHTYAAPGTYTVTLTATDDLGASSVATRTVTVKPVKDVPTDPYGQLVSSDDPMLYWRLGEADGTTAYDYSRQVHDGTYAGATLGQDSLVAAPDKAVNLSGEAAVASQEQFANPTTFTSEAWFATTSAGGRIIGFGNTAAGRSTNYDRHIYLDSSGRIVFGIWNGGSYTITTAGAYNDGAWHHVVGTLGPDGMALYVDGDLVGTNAHSGVDAYNGYWRLGADNIWDGGGQLNGLVDEAAVYDHVLTASQVRAHYRASGVFVNSVPTASFTADKDGLTVGLDASASGDADGTIASYAWDFGDGATSSQVAPTHTYAGEGTYTVSLTVTDDLGASATSTRTLGVREPSPAPADAYGQAVDADAPLLYWRLDETTGDVARDATSHVIDGTYAGATLGEASPVTGTGRAVGFSGDGFAASDDAFVNPTTFSVEAWFATGSPGQRIIGFGNAHEGRSANYDRHVFLNDAGQLVFGVWNDSGSHTVTTAGTYADGGWHHVVGTMGASGMALYVDGVLAGTDPTTVPQAYTGHWRVGTDNTWSGSGEFTGRIDEAAVYSTVLSAERVSAHYAASLVSNAAPLADFSATCTGASCELVATASDPDGSIAGYEWDLGDGSAPQTTASVSHVYATAGTYTVTLVVTDDRGTRTTVTRDVDVVIPNSPPAAVIADPVVNGLVVDVDGSGSTDPDGTIASYSWDFGDGSPAVTGATATHAYGIAGTFPVTLTVTDDDGATDTATVDVTVDVPNLSPAAVIDPVSPAGLTVDVDGSGSSDPDGVLVDWQWTFGDGGTASGATASHTYAGGGTFTITLTVTDNRGGQASASTEVTIVAPNQAPTAVIGTPVVTGLSVDVDGTGSSDPENTALTYAWTFGDGATATGATASHAYATDGTYTVTLLVTDAGGASNSATTTVTVATPNAAPVAVIGTPVVDHLTVQVDGSGSNDDGAVAGYAWTFGDGGTASTAVATHSYATAGTYTVTLVVTDNLGLASDPVTTTVTVAAPNTAPVPHIATPVVDGLTVDVDGSGSTDDGTIASWAWSFGEGADATGATASHTYAAGGTYTITLTVTDNLGVSASTTTSVTVVKPNEKPVAVIATPTVDLNSVSVDGSGSTDADGSITSWAWQFGDGATANTATASHAYAAGGTYTVTLTVTDNLGATGTATRQVTVSAPPVTALATDTFSRTGSRWGTAEVGGAWTDSGAAYFATDGSLGQVTVSRAGSGPSATLNAVSAADVTLVTDVALAARPTGSAFLHQSMARLNGTTYYLLTTRFETTGAVRLILSRVVGGAETQLRTVTASGITYNAGDRLRVRFDVHGTSLDGKVWPVTGSEPATAQASITDATIGGAGAVGLRFYTGSGTTSLPTHASVDNFQVAPYTDGVLENQAPVARFDATPTSWRLAVDAAASSDDGSITAYAWNFGDGSTATGRTADHTYAANGTYTVTLTVTDDRGATGTLAKTVTVANATPTAAFSATPAERTLAVDASASSDDGTIAGYAWEFGDGGTATGKSASHTYAADGTYTVVLTVTDEFGVTGTLDKTVTVANAAPVAGFTSSSIDLTLAVDASTSTDDGGIVAYAWAFGDGATATGETATHAYAAAGTYTVELTVTDAHGLTSTSSAEVTVAVNQAPTASFTAATADLKVTVDGRDSADPDGTIASWAWEFGDGGTGTGDTATHTYASAGTYTVKLTVTDDKGRTDSSTKPVTVTAPAVTVVASDTFSRTVASGWGTAPTGGAWTVSAAMFSVDGTRGLVTLPAASKGPVARLASVSERDVSIVTDFALDQVPVGGTYYHQVLARMSGTTSYYMLTARIETTGALRVYVSRVVSGTETVLRTVAYTSFGYAAGERLSMRLDVSGTGTTNLAAKVWRATGTEPATAQVTATDTTAVLQSAGAIGIRAYTGSGMTSLPLVVSVGGFRAERL